MVVLYLVIGEWRVPWSFRVWRGKGYTTPVQLACKLLATVPLQLSQGRVVIVQADTEFGTVEFLQAVRKRSWRAVVGMHCNRKMSDGRTLKQLYRNGQRGQQVLLEGIGQSLTVSWFWLKRAGGKRELRFVVATHPYSGNYLVRLGRKRWASCWLFQNCQTSFWFASFRSNHKVRGVPLAAFVVDCLFTSPLD